MTGTRDEGSQTGHDGVTSRQASFERPLSASARTLPDVIRRWRAELPADDERRQALAALTFPGRRTDEDDASYREREAGFVLQAARAIARSFADDNAAFADPSDIDAPLCAWLDELVRQRVAQVCRVIDRDGLKLISRLSSGWMARSAFPEDDARQRTCARSRQEDGDGDEPFGQAEEWQRRANRLDGDFPSEAWLKLVSASLRHIANGGAWPPERPFGWMASTLEHFLNDYRKRELRRRSLISATDVSAEGDDADVPDGVRGLVNRAWAQMSTATEEQAAEDLDQRIKQELCSVALQTLGPNVRVVLRLSYGWRLTSEEYCWIAKRLGCSVAEAIGRVRMTLSSVEPGRGDLELSSQAIADLMQIPRSRVDTWRKRGLTRAEKAIHEIAAVSPVFRDVVADLGSGPSDRSRRDDGAGSVGEDTTPVRTSGEVRRSKSARDVVR